jgi:hypothetical protein
MAGTPRRPTCGRILFRGEFAFLPGVTPVLSVLKTVHHSVG